MKGRWFVQVGAVAASLVVGVLALALQVGFSANRTSRFDCEPQPLARIEPGTRIVEGPPRGWTHLVSKSHSRLAGEDVEKLNSRSAELAQFLFSVIVARVGEYPTPYGVAYRLEEVAAGLGTRVGQVDMIINSKTQSQLGANLGFLERCVLSGAEKEDDRLVVQARSETSLFVDIPAIMYLDRSHRAVVLRYLFMVHPQDGRLEVVVWRIDLDAQGEYRLADAPAVRRYLGGVEQYWLHVDANETLAGVPNAKTFARTRMPAGDPLALPRSLRGIAGARRLTPEMANQIDTEIRQALGF